MKLEYLQVGDPFLGRELLLQELGGFFLPKRMPEMEIQLEARAKGEVVGASAAYRNDDKAERFFHLAGLDPLSPVLSLSGLAVREDWRGKGVGSALMRYRERVAREKGYRFLIGQAWVESPSPGIDILLHEGMVEIASIEKYWEREEPISDYCPLCGDICLCTAALFLKEI